MRQINIQLNAVFNYAVKYYDLAKNPTKAVDTIGKRQKRQAFGSLEEFSKVIAQVDKPELKLAYLLLFYSGMRIGELLALSPADFDFTAGTINISKSVMMSTGKVTTPKTPYSVRVVSMPPALMKEVQDYINHFMEPPERIFTYSQKVYRDYLKRYAIKAGVPPIHVHDLRHSHASYLIHNNVPVTTISRRLGHANASVTLSVYSHMYEESAGDVAVMLEKAFICGQNVVTEGK
ncbi:site-specific integrase [Selenomonas sp. AE3005]|uniref:site-specific integrase n=1 Tax=Selenomonas sp. AE3005 TaxID=1485543 RepID=UPI00068CEBB9|nr:site-specific integrase [Selenomonas sp. AE3005]